MIGIGNTTVFASNGNRIGSGKRHGLQVFVNDVNVVITHGGWVNRIACVARMVAPKAQER